MLPTISLKGQLHKTCTRIMGCAASAATAPSGHTPTPISPTSSTDSIDEVMDLEMGGAVFFLDRGLPAPPTAPPPTKLMPLHSITLQPPARPPHARQSSKVAPPPALRPDDLLQNACTPGVSAARLGRVHVVHKPPSPALRRLRTCASAQRAYERHQNAASGSSSSSDFTTASEEAHGTDGAAGRFPRRSGVIDVQERQRQCEQLSRYEQPLLSGGGMEVRPQTPSSRVAPMHFRTRSRQLDEDEVDDPVTDLRICRLMRRTPSGRLARACARQTARAAPPPTIIVVTSAAAAPSLRGGFAGGADSTARGGEGVLDETSMQLPPTVQQYTLSRSERRQILKAHREQLRMLPDVKQTISPRPTSPDAKSRRRRR